MLQCRRGRLCRRAAPLLRLRPWGRVVLVVPVSCCPALVVQTPLVVPVMMVLAPVVQILPVVRLLRLVRLVRLARLAQVDH